jgi:chromosome partitioning protein
MSTTATAPSGAPHLRSLRNANSYVVPVMNGKGGVGKTMVTLALAAHTAAANGRALVVDVDPQGNAHDLTKTMTDPGYDVVHELNPAELTRISRLRDYDSIFADCPGSLEHQEVLGKILEAATFAIIPYDHKPEALMPTVRTAEKVRAAGAPHAVVLTKVDPRRGEDFIKDAWATLDAAGIPHFRSVIREYEAWPKSLLAGVPITRYAERHAPKIREDVASLHTELLLSIGRLAPAGGPR